MPTLRSISQLILTVRKRIGLKQEVLGQLVGCTGSYITKLEKGVVIPSPILAMKLEKTLRLKKGILTKNILEIKMREVSLKRQALTNARLGGDYSADHDVLVPLYAPSNHLWTDRVERHVAIPRTELNEYKNFLIRAQDDCNNLIGINKGDLLFIEIRKAKEGETCIFCVNAIFFIKRYNDSKGRMKLSPNSSNGNHKATTHTKDDRNIIWKGVVRAIYLKKI